MKKLIVILLAVFLLAGCDRTNPEQTTVPTTDPTTAPTTEATTQPTTAPTTAPTETTAAPTEPTYMGNFTQADVDLFTELFQQKKGPVNYYNRLMFAEFDSPENVNLNRMFYDQDTDEAGALTDAEKTFLASQPQIALGLSVVRVSREKMDAALKAHLGLGLEDVTGVGMQQFAYFKDTDCYYNSKGDVGIAAFEILGGTKLEDGTVEIYYRRWAFGDFIITLHQTDAGYLVKSNVPMVFAFTQEDIDTFTELFSQKGESVNYYNRLLNAEFEHRTEVDLFRIFCDQDADEAGVLTDKEMSFLSGKAQINLDAEVMRVSKEKMNAVLQDHLDVKLFDTGKVGLDRFVYFGDTNSYYRNTDSFGSVDFEITEGTWLNNGNVEIHYSVADSHSGVITLRNTEKGYVVLSNLIAS